MNKLSNWHRHEELTQVAERLGADLPSYPTLEELNPVVKAIMLETHCVRASAHYAIVEGVLRPKRRCANTNPIHHTEDNQENENR